MRLPGPRPSAYHAGLRKEAHDWLTNDMGGLSHPSEEYVREMREKSLEFGDEVAHALWSRLLWKLYVKERYERRVQRHQPTVLKLVSNGGES